MRPLYFIVGLGVVAIVALVMLVLRIATKKRVFGTLLIVALLAAGALIVLRLLIPQSSADPLASGEVYTVQRGDVAEVVEAAGNLAPLAQLNVAFATSGNLVEVKVSTGDRVSAGQVLAVLDTTDLELQLAQSQAALRVAEANMNKVLAGARPEDITATQNSLSQAYANLTQQQVSLSAATERARLSWVESANSLRDAQASYTTIYWDNRKLEDKIGKENVPQANYDNEARALRAVENAEAAMEQARLAYEAAKQQEESGMRTARSQVSTARANLEKLTTGPVSTDVAAAQASVEQSRASLAITQAQLEKATLRAPFSGVVGKVLADVDTQVTPATPILVLFDPSGYQVDVEVDEVDVSKVQVGQPVHISLDALPGVTLTARVEEVALTSTPGQGVVTYQVRVRLDSVKDTSVRAGMTANGAIVTREAQGVLIVPRRAVRLVEGKTYVEQVVTGARGKQLESVEVQLGLSDPQYVEITAGLQEGDQVFVRGVVQNALQQILGGSSSGGGGLRFGGGSNP